MANLKIGGPRNFYNDVNVKKLGLDKAAKAINDNTDKNAEQDGEITSIKSKNIEQDGAITGLDTRVTALENAPQPSAGVGPEVIAEIYAAEGVNPEYEQGDIVEYNDGYTNEFYEALTDTTAEPGDQTAWQVIHTEEISPTGGMIPAGGYVISNNTLYHNKGSYPTWFSPNSPGSDFEEVTYSVWAKITKTYNPGDYVMYADELYVCDSRTTGAFDPDDWTKITVSSCFTDPNRLCPRGDEDEDDGKVVTYNAAGNNYVLRTPESGIQLNDTGVKTKIGKDQYGNPIYQAYTNADTVINCDEWCQVRSIYAISATRQNGDAFEVAPIGAVTVSRTTTASGNAISIDVGTSGVMRACVIWSEEAEP